MDERTWKTLAALYLLGCAVYAGVEWQRWRERQRERERELRHETDMALRGLGGHLGEVCQRLAAVELELAGATVVDVPAGAMPHA